MHATIISYISQHNLADEIQRYNKNGWYVTQGRSLTDRSSKIAIQAIYVGVKAKEAQKDKYPRHMDIRQKPRT